MIPFRRTPSHPNIYLLSVLAVAGVTLWFTPLLATLRLAIGSATYSHILLVFPVSIALLWLDLRETPAEPVRGWRLGSALLLASLSVRLLLPMYAAGSGLSLFGQMLALVAWIVGSFILCCGTRVFWRCWASFAYLLWAAPLPAVAVDRVVSFLQHASAVVARLLFMGAGVPVAQDGIILYIPGLDIEVAPSCSGIRSSILLLMVSIVLAHLFLRSWRRGWVLVAAAMVLSVLKNGLRIFVIAGLGASVDAGFLDGGLHRNGGILFFTLALAGLAGILWLLRGSEQRQRGLRTASLVNASLGLSQHR